MTTSSVAPAEDKLIVGGQLRTTSSSAFAGFSALAQVDLAHGWVDFVHYFEASSAVIAVAHDQERSHISALVSSTDLAKGDSATL